MLMQKGKGMLCRMACDVKQMYNNGKNCVKLSKKGFLGCAYATHMLVFAHLPFT